jgi:hypothetical protein
VEPVVDSKNPGALKSKIVARTPSPPPRQSRSPSRTPSPPKTRKGGKVIRLPHESFLPTELVSNWQEKTSEWQVTYADGSWKPKTLQEVGDRDIVHPATKRWIAGLFGPGDNIRVRSGISPKAKCYPFKVKSVSKDCETITGYYYSSYKEGKIMKWRISPFQLAYDISVDEFEEVLQKTSKHGHGRFQDVGVTFDRM